MERTREIRKILRFCDHLPAAGPGWPSPIQPSEIIGLTMTHANGRVPERNGSSRKQNALGSGLD